jgi:CRP-like cAMP-binding protein
MSREQIQLLEPQLEPIDLARHKSLEVRDRKIDYVYFIEAGLASVVANGRDGNVIEIGLIGREGVTGLALLLNADRTPLDTTVQVAGHALRVRASGMREVLDKDPGITRMLTNYVQVFMVQAAFTALANGRHNVEDRLSRWLLMAHDGADRDEIPLTHALLAVMLGVRRPGVTVALSALERRGLIAIGRGSIIIIDREGLEESAHGIYGQPEAEYKRLLG